jgi:hypothetical protein
MYSQAINYKRYNILVGNREGRHRLGDLDHTGYVGWVQLAQDRFQGLAFVNNK